jgi:hypothetical protein
MLLLFAVFISIPTFGQDKKIETNYSDPFQIDSSEYFVIPKLLIMMIKRRMEKVLIIMHGEAILISFFIILKQTKQKKLFNQLALISSF